MSHGALNGAIVTLQNKNSGLFLDVGMNDWNVCQQEKSGEIGQRFILVHREKNVYHIHSEMDRKAVDLSQNSGEVIVYSFHGHVNQQWRFEVSSEGTWMISSMSGSNRAISIPDSSVEKGCKLSAQEKGGGDNQRFYMQIIGWENSIKAPDGSLHDAIITLQNKNSGLFLDVGVNDWNICQQKNSGEIQQRFKLVHKEKNIYHIHSEQNGKVVDLADGASGGDKNGGKVIMYQFHGHKNQQWNFQQSSNGTWMITSMVGANRAITVPDSSTEEGSHLIVHDNQSRDDQVFYMQIVGGFQTSLLSHFESAIARISEEGEDFSLNIQVIEEALDYLPKDKLDAHGEQIHKLAKHLSQKLGDDYPTPANPVKKESPNWPLLNLISYIYNSHAMPDNIKIPVVEEFPYDFPEPMMGVSSDLSLKADKEEFHPTGFYLEAGKTLKVHVQSKSGEKNVNEC